MYPHPIRLRGRWDFEVLSEPASACGRYRYRRTFHRPSNLDPHERLWLVCEGRGTLFCNGRLLGEAPNEFEITPLLAAQNEVRLEVELGGSGEPSQTGCHSARGTSMGEVRLEVRERQFLDQWRLWFEDVDGQPRLRLDGHVAGEPCDTPLELVVRGPEEELLYAPVMAGSHVDLSAIPGALTSHSRVPQMELEVRLIRGGTRIWEARRLVSLPLDSSR